MSAFIFSQITSRMTVINWIYSRFNVTAHHIRRRNMNACPLDSNCDTIFEAIIPHFCLSFCDERATCVADASAIHSSYSRIWSDYFSCGLTSMTFSNLRKFKLQTNISNSDLLKTLTNQNRSIFRSLITTANYGQPSLFSIPCEFCQTACRGGRDGHHTCLALKPIRCRSVYLFAIDFPFAFDSIVGFHSIAAIPASANTRR